MNYTFRFENLEEDNGSITFENLTKLAKAITNVGYGAIMHKLTGMSATKPSKELKLDFTLKSLIVGSTILEVEAPPLTEVLNGQQLGLFQNIDDLDKVTAVSLVMETLSASIDENGNHDILDGDLMTHINLFKKLFHNKETRLTIRNEGSMEPVLLDKSSFTKIENLKKQTKPPQLSIINGELNVIDFAKNQISIETKEGKIPCELSEELMEEARKLGGKNVSVRGKVHFRPSGKSSKMIVETLWAGQANEKVFNKLPTSYTSKQILFQEIERKKGGSFKDIIGKWPGDETLEEFEEILKTMSNNG